MLAGMLLPRSASRSKADLRNTESRDKAFDVCLPLESGHRSPTSLRSAHDSQWTLMALRG